jgi:hypothetical protein
MELTSCLLLRRIDRVESGSNVDFLYQSVSLLSTVSVPFLVITDPLCLPCRIDSCWNGMIALTAEPFRTTGVNPRVHERVGPSLHAGQNSFRPVKQAPKFRSALRSQGECGTFRSRFLEVQRILADDSRSISFQLHPSARRSRKISGPEGTTGGL